MARALGLVSGGLDSSLAAMTLMRQGIEVVGITFVTPFFGAEKARIAAQQLGHELIVEDISRVHLEMVKAPAYGYGRNMNPCIDCHGMMFRLAGERMAGDGFDFLFSGEVLGQRPMSQNANALRSVSKVSGYPDHVLRPLSAKHLPITPMEESGLVDRERLLDLQGRSRKPQLALAKEWGYIDPPSSGGGCLLTEAGFSNQLRDLIQHKPEATVDDVNLLKAGRQFRLSAHAKLTVGRNRADNEMLQQLMQPHYISMRSNNFSGPMGVLTGELSEEAIKLAAAIIATYGKGKDEAEVEVLYFKDGEREVVTVPPLPRDKTTDLMIR